MKKVRHLKWSLIRPNCVKKQFWSDPIALDSFKIRFKCARMRFWSDPIALEPFMIRLKCARIRLWSDFSDHIDPWSDQLQTMVQIVVRSNFHPDTVILVREHTGVRSTGSDHKPIWGCTPTLAVRHLRGLHKILTSVVFVKPYKTSKFP